MKPFDEGTYRLYSATFNKKEKEKADKQIDNQFNAALKGLVRECIKFTKMVENEKNNPEINFRDCLRFEMEL